MKKTKDSKEMLFEMMGKVNPDFKKPQLNENIQENKEEKLNEDVEDKESDVQDKTEDKEDSKLNEEEKK